MSGGLAERPGKPPSGGCAKACFSRRRPGRSGFQPLREELLAIDPTQRSTHRPPAAALLIHGYGNPLRGDDGFGPAVIEALKECVSDVEGIVLHVSHQLTPELVESMADADSALLIDAAAQGEAGFIRLEPVQPSAPQPGATHHHCTPQALLELCNQLYGRAPRLFIASVVGADFGYREGLSPTARKALPLLVERILAWIEAEQQK